MMGIKEQIEKVFGLPPLNQVSDVLKALPDEPKLRLVKQILVEANKVKGSPEELQMVLELVRLIVSADIQKVEAVRDITSNLVKLSKLLPKEGLRQLPIREVIAEIRKGA